MFNKVRVRIADLVVLAQENEVTTLACSVTDLYVNCLLSISVTVAYLASERKGAHQPGRGF